MRTALATVMLASLVFSACETDEERELRAQLRGFDARNAERNAMLLTASDRLAELKVVTAQFETFARQNDPVSLVARVKAASPGAAVSELSATPLTREGPPEVTRFPGLGDVESTPKWHSVEHLLELSGSGSPRAAVDPIYEMFPGSKIETVDLNGDRWRLRLTVPLIELSPLSPPKAGGSDSLPDHHFWSLEADELQEQLAKASQQYHSLGAALTDAGLPDEGRGWNYAKKALEDAQRDTRGLQARVESPPAELGFLVPGKFFSEARLIVGTEKIFCKGTLRPGVEASAAVMQGATLLDAEVGKVRWERARGKQ